jgi:hypothetical protein
MAEEGAQEAGRFLVRAGGAQDAADGVACLGCRPEAEVEAGEPFPQAREARFDFGTVSAGLTASSIEARKSRSFDRKK